MEHKPWLKVHYIICLRKAVTCLTCPLPTAQLCRTWIRQGDSSVVNVDGRVTHWPYTSGFFQGYLSLVYIGCYFSDLLSFVQNVSNEHFLYIVGSRIKLFGSFRLYFGGASVQHMNAKVYFRLPKAYMNMVDKPARTVEKINLTIPTRSQTQHVCQHIK